MYLKFDFAPFPLEFEVSHTKQYTIIICVPVIIFFILTRIFEFIYSSVLNFCQYNLSWRVYIDCFTLVSYSCSFEFILSLVLNFSHWNLNYSTKRNIYKYIGSFLDILSVLYGYLSSF